MHKNGILSDYFFCSSSYFLKLLERHICTHLMLYLLSYNLISSRQSGLRLRYSNESILIKTELMTGLDQVKSSHLY